MTETFRTLIAWQRAKDLSLNVYKATKTFPREEQYGIVSQLRRASVSVMSNIAEGRGRGTTADFRHFLCQARGSLYEVESQLELAKELGYMDKISGSKLLADCDEASKILNGLIKSCE